MNYDSKIECFEDLNTVDIYVHMYGLYVVAVVYCSEYNWCFLACWRKAKIPKALRFIVQKHLLIYDVHMYQCIDIHWRIFLWVGTFIDDE